MSLSPICTIPVAAAIIAMFTGKGLINEGEVSRRLGLPGVPAAAEENIRRCVGLFLDLNAKAVNGEISTNSVDLRGMIAALRLMTDGMAPNEAIAVSITNKCFDEYEYALVRDVVMTRFAQ